VTGGGEALLAAGAVVKRYGPTVALDGVDFDLRAGEVHAVVGENGAGKSTLARVLVGAARPDSGAVTGAAAGRGRGLVAMVPQALSLIGELSLVEHLALAAGPGRFRPAAARARLREAAELLGGGPDPDRPTGELSMPEQQLGELGLALALGARVLIVDEPTSSLGPAEVERLVAALRGVAARGGGVVLVTHRVREALGAADRVTVLRGGRRVFNGPTAGIDADTLAVHMVGALERRERPRPAPGGAVRLRAADITAPPLAGVGIEVAGGEIVGVAGVAGGGQEALAEVLAGIRRPAAGVVEVDGRPVTGDARAAVAAGVAYVPERRGEALVPELPGSDNAVLLALLRDRGLRRRWTRLRDRKAEIARAAALYERYDVRPRRPELPAGALSGGNQQKLVVGRELTGDPAVVIAHGPTLGLDLRAADAVRHDLRSAAAAGAAVVVLSTDLDEVTALADRVIVLSAGRVTDAFSADEAVDAVRVGRAMAGHATPMEATG
jgi:ABC-type uncharacterized transport system ATPase subunit